MDGTKGQVLTKQSETNGDANWEDIEANEVFVGNEEEAPSSAKIIVEEDDFVGSSTLSKAEVYVGAEEPTTGEKVWFNKNKNSIYVRNSNGVYEEFIKKSEEVYSTEEQRIGTWIDGKPLYRKIIETTMPETPSNGVYITKNTTNIPDMSFGYVSRAIAISNNQYYTLPYINNSGYATKCFIEIQDGNNLILANGNTSFNNCKTFVVLEYTKTTD